MGWLTMALPLLQSEETPLETGPITTEQVSWAGSIMSIGALLGNFTIGYLTNKIGSRHATFILGIPQMVSELFCSSFEQMRMIARQVELIRFWGVLHLCFEGLLVIYVFRATNFGLVYFKDSHWLCHWWSPNLQCSVSHSSAFQKNKLADAEKSFRFYKGCQNRKESLSALAQFEKMKYVAKAMEENSKITATDLCKFPSHIFFHNY